MKFCLYSLLGPLILHRRQLRQMNVAQLDIQYNYLKPLGHANIILSLCHIPQSRLKTLRYLAKQCSQRQHYVYIVPQHDSICPVLGAIYAANHFSWQ